MSLLELVSEDILKLVVFEWLDNLFAIDGAIVNRSLRSKYLQSLKYLHYDCPITFFKATDWKYLVKWMSHEGRIDIKMKYFIYQSRTAEEIIDFCQKFCLLPQIKHMTRLELSNGKGDSRTNRPWLSFPDLLVSLPHLETIVIKNMHIRLDFTNAEESLTMLMDNNHPPQTNSYQFPLQFITFEELYFAPNEVLSCFAWLGKHCQCLRELKFPSPSYRLTLSHVISILSYFPELQTLELMDFNSFAANGDDIVINHANLQHLLVGVDYIRQLIITCPNLTHCVIDIPEFANFSFNVMLQSLAMSKHLTHFAINWNFQSDQCVQRLANSCPYLHTLSISLLSELTSKKEFRILGEDGKFVRLESLELCFPSSSHSSLDEMMDIIFCTAGHQFCSRLKQLSIRGDRHITFKGWQCLSDHLIGLESLYVEWPHPQQTNDIVEWIQSWQQQQQQQQQQSAHLCTTLRHITLSCPWYLDGNNYSSAQLELPLPQLLSITIKYLPLSKDCMERIRQDCPKAIIRYFPPPLVLL